MPSKPKPLPKKPIPPKSSAAQVRMADDKATKKSKIDTVRTPGNRRGGVKKIGTANDRYNLSAKDLGVPSSKGGGRPVKSIYTTYVPSGPKNKREKIRKNFPAGTTSGVVVYSLPKRGETGRQSYSVTRNTKRVK